jgi:hypothetical protein
VASQRVRGVGEPIQVDAGEGVRVPVARDGTYRLAACDADRRCRQRRSDCASHAPMRPNGAWFSSAARHRARSHAIAAGGGSGPGASGPENLCSGLKTDDSSPG